MADIAGRGIGGAPEGIGSRRTVAGQHQVAGELGEHRRRGLSVGEPAQQVPGTVEPAAILFGLGEADDRVGIARCFCGQRFDGANRFHRFPGRQPGLAEIEPREVVSRSVTQPAGEPFRGIARAFAGEIEGAEQVERLTIPRPHFQHPEIGRLRIAVPAGPMQFHALAQQVVGACLRHHSTAVHFSISSEEGYWWPVGRTPLSHFGRMKASARK